MLNSKPVQLFSGVLLLLIALPVLAGPISTIRFSASRLTVLNDGRDYTELIAEVRDSGGNLVPDNTQVSFQTNLGVFQQGSTVQTRAGSARIKLSSPQKGVATVTATVIGTTEKIDITFTDNPAETYQGNAYISVLCDDSLIYSAGDKVIEATGHRRIDPEQGFPGAHLSYRNIEIFADRIQLDCTTTSVRASGDITLKRGNHRLRCSRLYYMLNSGEGLAISEVDKKVRPVTIKGGDLKVAPVAAVPQAPVKDKDGREQPANNPIINDRFLEMVNLADAKLVITARQILLFPGEKLQFKRPHFYQDGQHLVSMPFYELGLYSSQLFSDQFLSVGSQGLGVDIPLYYDMTPGSTGTFSIRHGERTGRSVYATRPGWSLDLTQSYNSVSGGSNRYTGQFGLTGISRSDWGVRWNHSQEFGSDSRASMFIDLPQHRGLFASTNFSRQMGQYYLGLNLSGNRNFTGFSASGLTSDLYLETIPKKLGHSGYMYALGGTSGYLENNSGGIANRAFTQGVQARLFSPPFRLDKNTTVTNYLTVGNVWSTGIGGGNSVLASVSALRSFKGSNLQVTYDFTRQPTFITDGGSHRLSMSYLANGGTKWNMYVYGSAMLDSPTSSLICDLGYLIMPRWRFSMAASLQRFSAGEYRDYEVGISRSLGGRDLRVYYATFSHRIFFDVEASRF